MNNSYTLLEATAIFIFMLVVNVLVTMFVALLFIGFMTSVGYPDHVPFWEVVMVFYMPTGAAFISTNINKWFRRW